MLDHGKARQEENQLIQIMVLEEAPALEHIKADTSLEGKIITFCLTYFNHVMYSNLLDKVGMLGMVRGKRK